MTLDVRIDGAYVASSAPADPGLDPATPGGTPAFWQPGNPGAGQPATRFKAWWFNWLQESLRGIITGAGLTPDRTSFTQLLTALKTLFSINYGVFSPLTGNGAWQQASRITITVPAGQTRTIMLATMFPQTGSGTTTWLTKFRLDDTTGGAWGSTFAGDTQVVGVLGGALQPSVTNSMCWFFLAAGTHTIDTLWFGSTGVDTGYGTAFYFGA